MLLEKEAARKAASFQVRCPPRVKYSMYTKNATVHPTVDLVEHCDKTAKNGGESRALETCIL